MYLHILTDKHNSRLTFGAFKRHWGIYETDGNPKYKIDFSLQDRDKYPTEAKGIVKMPSRWCKFNGDKSNMNSVNKNYNLACEKADCTVLEVGASCGGMSFESKVSYAFNAYFQMFKQDIDHCEFDGLGEIVATNPSPDSGGPRILRSWVLTSL
ncbi:glucan endo-1,3-beta-glucosidase 8-like [Lycium barbarum]|uniref:glucan endo-1,3-beta-glucosidase 8-like n=1 Tax=Lycium barbarum TaxID=112863 RepID=UPI00293F734E|nr:glucan endo-1,3-beta-glucosidase 8-like [Lycium barbarum]